MGIGSDLRRQTSASSRACTPRRAPRMMVMSDRELRELWLLDRACEFNVPVRLVATSYENALRQWNVRPPLGWNRKIAFETLQSLKAKGEIVLTPSSEAGFHDTDIGARSDAGNVPAPEPLYGLSEAGWTRWEQCFLPDWNRYSRITYNEETDAGTARLEIICGSDECRIFALGSVVSVMDVDLSFGMRDVLMDNLSPWHATYWKVVPVGFRAYASIRWDWERDRCTPSCKYTGDWKKRLQE